MSPITVGKHIFEMPSFFSMLDDVQQRRIPQACKGNQLVSEQPIFHFNYHWKEIRDTPKRCSKSTDSRHRWVFVGSQMPKFWETSALPPRGVPVFWGIGTYESWNIGIFGRIRCSYQNSNCHNSPRLSSKPRNLLEAWYTKNPLGNPTRLSHHSWKAPRPTTWPAGNQTCMFSSLRGLLAVVLFSLLRKMSVHFEERYETILWNLGTWWCESFWVGTLLWRSLLLDTLPAT